MYIDSQTHFTLPRVRLPEAARDVTVLNRDEVAALTHETEVSRLAHCKRSAMEENDSDSDDDHQLLRVPDPDR